MSYQFATYEKQGHIAIVTINRPERMNAIHYATSEELTEIFDDFQQDENLWVAILTGAGERAFSSGHDNKAIADPNAPEHSPLKRDHRVARTPFGGICRNVEDLILKPIIAAVNGHSMGGGFAMNLACDIRIASENATFQAIEVQVGTVATSGAVQRLPRYISMANAMDMLLTGRRVGAQEALQMGLVSKVVPLPDLMPTAMEYANRICNNAPLAVRSTKELALRCVDLPLFYGLTSWNLSWSLLDRYNNPVDFVEGAAAFVEKRDPKYDPHLERKSIMDPLKQG